MNTPHQPAITDPSDVEPFTGSRYPEEFKHLVGNRVRRVLGDGFGLTDFGVNVLELAPGTASALRHWHTDEDEFVFVLEGEVVLTTDAGEQIIRSGQCAGFPKGVENGHRFENRSHRPARLLEIGSRNASDRVHYPDQDLFLGADMIFTKKNGEPYA